MFGLQSATDEPSHKEAYTEKEGYQQQHSIGPTDISPEEDIANFLVVNNEWWTRKNSTRLKYDLQI